MQLVQRFSGWLNQRFSGWLVLFLSLFSFLVESAVSLEGRSILAVECGDFAVECSVLAV